MKTEIFNACDRLLTGSLNGIWQGSIVALLVALTLRLLRRTNAATRHAVWFCTLLVLVGLIGAHCWRACFASGLPAKAAENDAAADNGPAESRWLAARDSEAHIPQTQAQAADEPAPPNRPEIVESSNGAGILFWAPAETRRIYQRPSRSLMDPAALPAELIEIENRSPGDIFIANAAPQNETLLPQPTDSVPASDTTSRAQPEPTSLNRLLSEAANPISWNLDLSKKVPRSASLLLLSTWTLFAGLRLAALVWRLFRIRELKTGSRPSSQALDYLFKSLRARLGIHRAVEIRVSDAHRSPVLLGFIHPVILLPAGETVDEAEPILRHELAHVCRLDDWANLAQHLIQAVFFVQPAVGWISRQLSLEREIACDDHVLQQDRRPRAYALMLANLAGRLQAGPPLLAPGVSANKSQLQQRIDMILNTSRNTSPRLAKTRLGFITSAAALLALAAIYAAPRVVLAQNETPPPSVNIPSTDTDISVASGVSVSADVAPVADGSVSVQTDSPSPTPAPDAVGPGPKPKPGGPKAVIVTSPSISWSVAPVAPIARVAPVPAVTVYSSSIAPMPPLPPMAVATAPAAAMPRGALVAINDPADPAAPPQPPVPGRPARPGRAPRASNGDAALEERLDRLEKMLQTLMAQQDSNPGKFRWEWHTGPDGANQWKKTESLPGSPKAMLVNPQALEEMARKQSQLNADQLGHIKEYAKRQAEYAQREADYAKRQVEQAQREVAGAADQARQAAHEAEKAMSSDQKRQSQEKVKVGAQKQLEVLRRQIEVLERQREVLDRKIEQLERNQEQLDEQGEEQGEDEKPRSEILQEGAKEKCIAQKTAEG